MARGKQQQEKKDGQHRKETKEERRARLQAEREAKEQCLKMLPFVGLAIFIFLIGFGVYVKSLPPKAPKVQKLQVPTTGSGNSNIKVSVEEDGTTPKVVSVEETVTVKEDEGETMEL